MTIVSSALSALTQGSDESWRWDENIKPASFRGVPFAVVTGEGQFGRRLAVHEYPNRDRVWTEDLGRGTRRITLQGFIVQGSRIYNAPDVFTQRDSLIAACETKGSGTLIHPSLGPLTVSISDGGLKLKEGMDQMGSFSFTLTCIESGLQEFAITTATTSSGVMEQSWFSTVTTSAAAVIAEVKGEILSIKHAATTIQNTLDFWANFVASTAEEATTLASSLNSTLGNLRFGRDCNGTAGGSISGLTGKITPASSSVNYESIVAEKRAQVISARTDIAESVSQLAGMSDISTVPDAVQALLVTLTTAVPSTHDQLQILESMMSNKAFDGTYYNDTTSQNVYAALTAYLKIMSAALFARLAANSALSGTDAAQILFSRGIAVLDTACLLASQHDNDDQWASLEQLREDFTATMLAQGLDNPRVTWQFSTPLPALAIANRIWQDAERATALVVSTAPIHPAFMPLSIEVLNSDTD